MKTQRHAVLCTIILVALLVLSSCVQKPHVLIYQSGATVWVLAPDQGTKEPLVKSVNYAAGLSNDLSQVTYSTDRYDLWIASIDKKNARQVITDQLRKAGVGIARVSWAPGDRKIAVWAIPVESPQSNLEKLALYVVDPSTNNVQVVATGVTNFAWTRAGNRLVVVREFDPRENPGIYLIATDDSSSKQLFKGLAEPYIAASLTSDKVAFVADKSAGVYGLTLFTLDLSSGKAVDLLQDSSFPFHSVRDPTWSPDGKQLAFIATIPGKNNMGISTLFAVNPQTHAVKELAKDINGPLVWSPTGHAIATTVMSSTQGIYQVNVETGNVQKLTDDEPTSSMIFEWR